MKIKSVKTMMLIAIMVLAPLTMAATKSEDGEAIKKQVESALSKAKPGIPLDSIADIEVVTVAKEVESGDTEDSRAPAADNDDDSEFFTKAVWIPTVAIVMTFGTGIAFLWLILYYASRGSRERDRLIEMSIREHQPLPDSFYLGGGNNASKRLGSGIIWICTGFAAMLFFFTLESAEMAWLGLIPTGVGISRVVIYLVEQNKKTNRSIRQRNDMPEIPKD